MISRRRAAPLFHRLTWMTGVLALLFACGGEPPAATGRSGTPPSEGSAGAADRAPDAAPEPGVRPLTVHFHHRVPYMYREGEKVRGLTADRLARVFEAAGVSYVWEETPPRRQMELLKTGRGRHAFLGWFRLPEREAYGTYSLPIYQDLPTIAVARAGTLDPAKTSTISDVLDRPGLRLLVRDGYSYGALLDERIRAEAASRVVTTVDNVSMLKMIHAGRADYFFIAKEEVDAVIEASGLPARDFVRIHFTDMPPGNERYILFSKEVEPTLIDRVNEAIRGLLTPGHEPESGQR